ncbi:MAG: DUF4124 domain-containing protein [Azoarcus sp.]|jgi:hypothetical protein|nr:DUF4124 domain-containing protein [Azoarcus sp.]
MGSMDERLRNLLCFGLLSIVCVSAADAQIYKWKDKDGKIVFGDMLPLGETAKIEKIAVSASAPTGASGTPSEPTDWAAKGRELEQRRILRAQEKAEADQAEGKKRKVCEEVRDRKRWLASVQGRRVTLWNSSKGGLDVLSDNDRETMNREVQQLMKELGCG